MSDETPTAAAANSERYEELVHEALAGIEPPPDLRAMATGLNLIRAANRLQQDLDTKVHRPAGVTWAGFRVLFAIFAVGSISPRSLARLSSVSAASITGVLHTLEGDGLVKRRRSRVDRRSFELELTKKGRDTVIEQFRANNERERLWAEALTRREQDTLARLLRKLLAYHPPEE